VQAYVTKALNTVNVDIRHSTRVTSTTSLSRDSGDQAQRLLQLSTGDTLVADMYIATHGLVPNSAFLPSNLLDEKGFVMVNEYLQATGAPSEHSVFIYALGDVCDLENSQFITCDRQSAYLAKSTVARLQGQVPKPHKKMSKRVYTSTLSISKPWYLLKCKGPLRLESVLL
jgi:apoptosis-inducing factor 2